VVQDLLSFIVTKQLPKDPNKPRTKQLSIFPGDFIDTSPVIRSFLLQLMLRVDSSHTEQHLQAFIDGNEAILGASTQFPELCMMIMHCIEDSKKCQQDAKKSEQEASRMTVKHMKARLERNFDPGASLVKSLSLAAEDRLAVNRLGHALHDLLTGAAEENELRELMKSGEDFVQLHPEAANLKKYLVRFIAARYQQNAVIEWKRREVWRTLLPEELINTSANDAADVYLIIDSGYKAVRNAISYAWLTGDYAELAEMVSQQGRNPKIWALAFHTLSLVNPCNRKDPAAFELLLEEQSWLRTIWAKTRDSCPQLLDRTHRHLAVHSLLVHFAAVIEDTKLPHALQIFRQLAENPGVAQNYYLPTMPQDETLEAKAAVRDASSWYRCANGHVYAIGDCGQPATTSKCVTCGVPVGGHNHAFVGTGLNVQQVQQAQLADTSRPGHILGAAAAGERSTTVREISGSEVAVIRFLLHTAMLQGSLARPEHMAQLIAPRQPAVHVAEFLIAHLLLNLRQISACLGRSEDDIIVLLHQIIEAFAVLNYQQGQYTFIAKASVRAWEKDFASRYIQPALKDLDIILARHRTAVKEDKEEASNALLDIIHEQPGELTNRAELLSLPQAGLDKTRV
jgi:hypothetical protein